MSSSPRILTTLMLGLAMFVGPGLGHAVAASSDNFDGGVIARTATMTRLGVADASPSPSQRVTSVEVSQDLAARTMTATVHFAAPPTLETDSFVYAYLGRHTSAGACDGQLAIGGLAAGPTAGGQFFEDGDNAIHAVTRSLAGAALTLTSAPHELIRTSGWDCAFAVVRSTDTATLYQQFASEELVPVQVPVLDVSAGSSTQGSYAGTWTTIRVDVRNAGQVDARNVRVTLLGTGMAFRPKSRTIALLGSGTTKPGVRFRVKLSGARARSLKIRASAPESAARVGSAAIKIARQPRTTIPRSLVGRAYWGFEQANLHNSSGWKNHGVWFVSRRHAYIGFATSGTLPRCRVTTRTCRPYSFDQRSGMVRLQGKRFKLTSAGFTFQTGKSAATKVRFSPLTQPKRGTRFAADLVHKDWSGYCLISCTSTTDRIAFSRSGRFLRSSTSVGSWPGLGQAWGTAPADMRGTWRIVSTGRIQLRYADGAVKHQTIAFEQNLRGAADPAGTGLLLGSTNYYPAS
ncbi:MAG: hypothetical protein ABI200_04340 [Gaiellales bacterium]